jgi:hypothetical protein
MNSLGRFVGYLDLTSDLLTIREFVILPGVLPCLRAATEPKCYERTRDQGTLGSIAIAIVEPLGGHLLCILLVA